jgi:hypothetical protein
VSQPASASAATNVPVPVSIIIPIILFSRTSPPSVVSLSPNRLP